MKKNSKIKLALLRIYNNLVLQNISAIHPEYFPLWFHQGLSSLCVANLLELKIDEWECKSDRLRERESDGRISPLAELNYV